jgi:hypothetical protein
LKVKTLIDNVGGINKSGHIREVSEEMAKRLADLGAVEIVEEKKKEVPKKQTPKKTTKKTTKEGE